MSKDVKNVPALRFKGYSDAWEKRKLGELAEFINGRAYKQDELLSSGKYPVLRVGNFYTNDKWYYSNLELPEKYYAEEGDLLYTWSATFGPHIWIGPKVIYHYHIWKVALKNIFEKDFALQFFEADRVRLLNSTNGSTMIHVTKKDMESKGVLLPDISEQRNIGELLRKADDLIAATQDSIEALGQAKKALLQHLFDQSWRFKGYSDPWEKRKLGEIARIFDGTHQTPNYQSSGIMFLSVENIQTLKSNKFISLEDFQKDFKVSPRTGDILMTRIGNIGTTNVVKSTRPIAYYVSLALIRPNDAIDVYYLNYAINGLSFQRELRRRTLSVAFPQKINKQEIGKSIVDLPSPSEQIQIGNLFVLLDNLIAATQSRLSSLESLKKSLLQDLFI